MSESAAIMNYSVSDEPLPNEVFYPSAAAEAGAEFYGTLRISPARMRLQPELDLAVLERYGDAGLFPGLTLEFITLDGLLVPVQRGQMVKEVNPGRTPSFWCAIAQFGRVWREAGEEWSWAAFPLTLVSHRDTHAHQGLVRFRYKERQVSAVQFQFVQQTAPYLLKQHFLAWGSAEARWSEPRAADPAALRRQAQAELARRLAHRPLSDLAREFQRGRYNEFGAPVREQWRVQSALVRDGVLYYQDARTPYGNFPYPLEMRFGVRSILKAVAAPLALLRLAYVYGPYVLALKIGDYVEGLDGKYRRVRFLDAANMASGFGGTGSWETHPNDPNDGYLEGDYDAWLAAPSHAAKLEHIVRTGRPYPWEPGTVMRYRDQDFYLLGAAIDRFLKSVRGPTADAWDMLRTEVFKPIGIFSAPIVRTREAEGRRGVAWFHSGYYPTLDDLGKIALLFQNRGAAGSRQILHRGLTEDLLNAKDALVQSGDASLGPPSGAERGPNSGNLYKMGFHFIPYVGAESGRQYFLPTMRGWGENEIVLYPNSLITIRIAKAGQLPAGQKPNSGPASRAIRMVDRLSPL
jgi:CubicO group peptidase (beta-lactamase class C family)